jgi:hypothetical protein
MGEGIVPATCWKPRIGSTRAIGTTSHPRRMLGATVLLVEPT